MSTLVSHLRPKAPRPRVNGLRPIRSRPLECSLLCVLAFAGLALSPASIAQRAPGSNGAFEASRAEATGSPLVAYPSGTIYTVAGNGTYN